MNRVSQSQNATDIRRHIAKKLHSMSSIWTDAALSSLAETVVWIVAFGLVAWLSEAHLAQRILALMATSALFCAVLVLVRRCRRAAGATLAVAIGIWFVSTLKMTYLGTPLVFGDLVNMVGYNLLWVLGHYPELALVGAALTVGVCIVIAWQLKQPGRRISTAAIFFAAACCALLTLSVTKAAKVLAFWDQKFQHSGAGIGTFAGSMTWWWRAGSNGVTMYGVADQALGGQVFPQDTPQAQQKPNIFMVIDESVFDPRVLGLPIEEEVDAYFRPLDGLSGLLSVNVHGAGTWVSEFSAMTGLDTRSFGDKEFFLNTLMEKRIHHSLIHTLKANGYWTSVVYSVDGAFMNAEDFYRSLGLDTFQVPDSDDDTILYGNFRDAELFEQAVDLMASASDGRDNSPVFVMVVTISNHGPHNRTTVAENRFPETRAWLADHASDPEHGDFREYYLRLRRSIEDYAELKLALASRFRDRPTLLIRFGDHQPQFTKKPPYADASRAKTARFTTYFAIEAINGSIERQPRWGSGPLDIAYLSTLVVEAAGLPRDLISQTRLDLMQSCEGRSFGCRDRRVARLRRTLLDQGLVQVDYAEATEATASPTIR